METKFAGFRFASDENITLARAAEDRVNSEIDLLGLRRHADELDEIGYTILSPEELGETALAASLRDKVLETAEQRYRLTADLEKGLSSTDNKMPFGNGLYMKYMIMEVPVFERALVQEKMLALVAYLLSESCKLSHMSATVKEAGDEFLELHVDAVGTPEQLSPYAYQANATWVLTDYSPELGSTCLYLAATSGRGFRGRVRARMSPRSSRSQRKPA